MQTTTYIILEDMCFHAYHGVYPEERRDGNEFLVNLRLKVDITQAARTDNVADTINYAEVCSLVKKEMDIPSNLLEHVCMRISDALFKSFPNIESLHLKLSKKQPPMEVLTKYASVEMDASR
jgi:dihydroneopterin aldolase